MVETKEGGTMPGNGKNTAKKNIGRDPVTGRFTKGNPSNGGRKKLPEELKEAFREAAPDALEVLKKIMLNDRARDADRIKAAEIILDRGYGKPVQAVDLAAETQDGGIGVVLMPSVVERQ
jgi:hypothetical protein